MESQAFKVLTFSDISKAVTTEVQVHTMSDSSDILISEVCKTAMLVLLMTGRYLNWVVLQEYSVHTMFNENLTITAYNSDNDFEIVWMDACM